MYNNNNNNRKSLDLKDLIRCVIKDEDDVNSFDNSLLDKEIRTSLFPIFHQVLLNPPNNLPSHVSHSIITTQKSNSSKLLNDNESHGFLYLFDKNTKDYYLNDGIKWIKSKVNVRMILFDDEKKVYKLKTHKKDLGSHVLRRQTFSGVDDNGIFWKKFEYKLIKKEFYYKMGDNSEKSEKLTVIDWPLIVHYLSRPTESNDTSQDQLSEVDGNNNNNSSTQNNTSYNYNIDSNDNNGITSSLGGLFKKENITSTTSINVNSNNNNQNSKKRDSSGFNIPSAIYNKFFKKSKVETPQPTMITPSTITYSNNMASSHNIFNPSHNSSPIMSSNGSSPESLLLSNPTTPSNLLYNNTNSSVNNNIVIEDTYLDLDFSDQSWTSNNLLFNQSPNSAMTNIFLNNNNNASNNLLFPNNLSTSQDQINLTTTTTTTNSSNGNYQLINQEVNNSNGTNNNTENEQFPICTIQSYTPDTSPSLEQSKIMVIVNGFSCFEKKSKLSSIYFSFWAQFDNDIEILALPVAPSVLEFISPIWGDSGISHFSIVCKQNGSKIIIQKSPPVPFCFTPSDHRGKLKIAFDRCKIYPPIQIIPKFKHTVRHLDLSNNALTNVDFLFGFYRLETLLLNNNMLTENTIFPQLTDLQNLDLSSNKIVFPTSGVFTESYKLFCYRLFQSTPSLQTLNLLDNEEYPSAPHHHYNYRIYITSRFPQLIRLDLKMVTLEERKHAQSVEFSFPDLI